MRPKKKAYSPLLLVLGAVITAVAAYYCAAGMHPGETIFEWKDHMSVILAHPARLYLNGYTGKTILVFFLVYFLAAMMYVTSRKNYLPGREMGSAQYADIKKVNRRLADLSRNRNDPENIVIIKRKTGKRRKRQ